MRSLTLKNIPDDIFEKLKEAAAIHRRSLNQQALVCFEKALASRKFDPDQFLAELEDLHRRVKIPPLTDELLKEAKAWGRK